MRKKNLVIKAISLGVSASMMLQPIAAMAEEVNTPVVEASEENEVSIEEVKGNIDEAEEALIDAKNQENIAAGTAFFTIGTGIITDETQAAIKEMAAKKDLDDAEEAIKDGEDKIDDLLNGEDGFTEHLDAANEASDDAVSQKEKAEAAAKAAVDNAAKAEGATLDTVWDYANYAENDAKIAEEAAKKAAEDQAKAEEEVKIAKEKYEEAVKAAADAADLANEAIANASEDAEEAVTKAKAALDKANELKAAMDDAKVKAGQEVDTAKEDLKTAQDELKKATEELAKAKAEKAGAEIYVASTGTALSMAEGYLALCEADAANKATTLEEKKAAVKALEDAKKNAEDAISDAEKALDDAKKTYGEKSEEYNTAKNALNAATSALNAANSAFTSATNDLAAAETADAAAKKAVQDVKDSLATEGYEKTIYDLQESLAAAETDAEKAEIVDQIIAAVVANKENTEDVTRDGQYFVAGDKYYEAVVNEDGTITIYECVKNEGTTVTDGETRTGLTSLEGLGTEGVDYRVSKTNQGSTTFVNAKGNTLQAGDKIRVGQGYGQGNKEYEVKYGPYWVQGYMGGHYENRLYYETVEWGLFGPYTVQNLINSNATYKKETTSATTYDVVLLVSTPNTTITRVDDVADGSQGDIYNDYQNRLSEAEEAADNAALTLEGAQDAYNEAKDAADEAKDAADEAKTAADEAKKEADDAKAAMDEADKNLKDLEKAYNDYYNGKTILVGWWFGPIYIQTESDYAKAHNQAVNDVNKAEDALNRANKKVDDAEKAVEYWENENNKAKDALEAAKRKVADAAIKEGQAFVKVGEETFDLSVAVGKYEAAKAAVAYANSVVNEANKAYELAKAARDKVNDLEVAGIRGEELAEAKAELDKAEKRLEIAKLAAEAASEYARIARAAYGRAYGKGIGLGIEEANRLANELAAIEELFINQVQQINAPQAVVEEVVEEEVEEEVTEVTEVAEINEEEVALDSELEINDEEVALAPNMEEQAKMSWWWLLIVLALGGAGAEMYRRYRVKKINATNDSDK